jgi:predicted O-linked N-acetylglucosamine transferase (SPINDLY family)
LFLDSMGGVATTSAPSGPAVGPHEKAMLRRLFQAMRDDAGKARACSAAARNEAGLAAWHRGDLANAETELRAALDADPGFAPAYGNLGMVLWEQRRIDEGLATLRRGVEIDPAHPGVRINLANALAIGGVPGEALVHYRDVLRREPHHALATANALKPMLDVCDWNGADALVEGLVARWRTDPADGVRDCLTPFLSQLVNVPQDMRLDIARHHSRLVVAEVGRLPSPPRSRRPPGGRLHIGYLSADFHDHATAHLAAGVFEHHDRERFEVHAYSFGIDDGSALRRRLIAAFEHFHDVRPLPHAELARRIAADGIDVLVDLKGYTGEARPQVLALRPAPVQASWLGYPGTMAAPFIDCTIADAVVIPPGAECEYGEPIVRLPDSYQANDDRQPIAPDTPGRTALGLPESAFVFACFNDPYKIDRRVFAAWMRVLAAVPGSVLWLLGGHANDVLQRVAGAAGIDPQRLVFAGRLPKAEHLARHCAADLFLDTHGCCAHTTASDALWAGLPVLACPGEGFASRVSASLLHAVGLGELVSTSAEDYERRAIALAADRGSLDALRARLEHNRTRLPLFDTARFTRNLEAVYLALADRGAARAA